MRYTCTWPWPQSGKTLSSALGRVSMPDNRCVNVRFRARKSSPCPSKPSPLYQKTSFAHVIQSSATYRSHIIYVCFQAGENSCVFYWPFRPVRSGMFVMHSSLRHLRHSPAITLETTRTGLIPLSTIQPGL
jgi:hypothetical protein